MAVSGGSTNQDESEEDTLPQAVQCLEGAAGNFSFLF